MAFILSKPNFKSNKRKNYENQFKLPKRRPSSTLNPKRKAPDWRLDIKNKILDTHQKI